MKTILLMDIVIAAFGLYLVFVALGMKRNGKINTLVIVNAGIRKHILRVLFRTCIFLAL